ncbi:putative polysaccharide biosynthesis protein [Streptococcus acidominimus]|uniref:Polysaccharide biosynthesis protein n=1 Tax=Streptococcus acidominimus TaxID=1326 RepID=A0A1Q8EEL4_STRAI|nr:polysaccharide biosynthesis protein [Streptococcus acidominimus]MBF0846404.1 polysaccharide biosynthesis protein [Streptococcus danieliae]MBF0819766.1 polysaccharide biosynthesis protein [Streptococcus acidominimus]MBF0839247.1 polysaccharide biosynthesis protein [Streptococcus acidominimus]OLF50213.1 polysaccharide biosynthesis protein [Streptococcus acidominimus]TFU29468.1 polysaccharide biosynthesis protein [Streptococcus acidominimus]
MTKIRTTEQTQQQASMVRGLAWLTAGNFISRLIGIAYIIPWYLWMGSHRAEANGLFNMGYQVYGNFLLISTVGLPTAVAKQIAKYNVQGRQDISYYLVREFFKLMLILGAVFAGVMFISSPTLAELSGVKEQLTPVMYSLVPPLFIFPAMSIMRGFFQGHHDMKPYAISQIVEQIARVIWILVTTFYIMKLGSGDYLSAVIQSTFAAFIGMIASFGVLVYSLHKEGFIAKVIGAKPKDVTIDLKPLVLETLKEAVPLIILGSAIQIFQIIDQLTFINTLLGITDLTRTELLKLSTYMTANPSKITMLIIGITTSIGSVAIPMITERFVQKDQKKTADLIIDNIQLFFLLILPAIVGSVVLARPLYSVFYGPVEDQAIYLFVINLLLVFIQGLYSLLGVIIQAIFQNRKAMLYFFIGFAVKLVFQFPALYLFKVYGPLVSTAVALTVSVVLFDRRIDQIIPIPQARLRKNFHQVLGISLIMGLGVWLVETGIGLVFPATGYLSSAIHVSIAGFVGIFIFGILTLKTRHLDRLIGNRAAILRKKLHIS